LEKKRHLFEIQLNSIIDTDNPTKKEVEFILHDFSVSGNYAFIAKETAEKTLPTLKDMPIVALYHEKSSPDEDDDALGSHEVNFSKQDRATGEPIITMDTVPIGVFTEDAYITTIKDEKGEDVEVVAGKGVLWASRFPNVIGLLKEWIDEGIPVVSSMEILYDSYKVEDGITEILSYVYEGHCLLNSSNRGNHKKVYPAYDVSKLTKLVAQAMSQENIEEGEKMDKFKKVFELSHGDVRTLIYGQLDPTLAEQQYSWIAEVYDTYFIVNIDSYVEGDTFDKFFKFNYTKDDKGVTVDFDSKAEVFLKRNWEEVVPEEVQTQLNEKDQTITDLQTQVSEKDTTLATLTNEKDKIEKQFNSASETLIELNETVKALEPFKAKFEAAEFEKSLSEKQEFYSAKFSMLGGEEKYKTDEVQDLVKKAVYETEEGKEAVLQLNSMLVDMVQVVTEVKPENPVVREMASRRENLIPESSDFESRYSI